MATLPMMPVWPQPIENSNWSLFFDARLKRMSTVPSSSLGSGRMSMFSGSKCPVVAISRAERIRSVLEKSAPGLTRSSRRMTFSYRRSLPLMMTLLMRACGPSMIRISRSIESPLTFFSMGSSVKNR